MSTGAAAISLREELVALVGEENVLDDAALVAALAIDETEPGSIVRAASAEEISAVLKLCNEQDLTVVPHGGVRQQHVGAPPRSIDLLLDTSRLDTVHAYDPGDLTISVGAGLALGDLEKTLAQHHQFLPIEGRPEATVGELIATGVQGPMLHWAPVRDCCIGVSFVTGDGLVAKGGGRVVKNVAGYDLMKLLIGSHGSLGVITSANFKVYPKPRESSTFVLEAQSANEAIALRDRIAQLPFSLLAFEIAGPRALEYIDQEHHSPRDPDHHQPDAPVVENGNWQLAVRIAGSDVVLRRARRELGASASHELREEKESDLWRRWSMFSDRVFARHQNAMTMRIEVAPSDVPAAIKAVQESSIENNLLPAVTGSVGWARLTVAFIPLSVDPPSAGQYLNCASSLRGDLLQNSTATVLRCPTEAKRHFDVWGPLNGDLASMIAVKKALDPRSVLNRGRCFV